MQKEDYIFFLMYFILEDNYNFETILDYNVWGWNNFSSKVNFRNCLIFILESIMIVILYLGLDSSLCTFENLLKTG